MAIIFDERGVPITSENPFPTSLTGSKAQESLTDSDAVSNVLTFSDPIEAVEIWHDEEGLETFTVNGIELHVGPGGWARPVGGTPSAEVTIPADVTCAVTRLV